MKFRRLNPLSNLWTELGNSRSTDSRNWRVPANSSRLRHRASPGSLAARSRTTFRSSCSGPSLMTATLFALPSTVTREAVFELLCRQNVIFLHQLATQAQLGFARAIGIASRVV